MKAIELVRWSMQMSLDFTSRLAGDLDRYPMVRPLAGEGNHPVWLLGHLATIEASVPHILVGEGNPREGWGEMFASGTRPGSDASKYPSFGEVFSAYREGRVRNMALLERIGDGGLDEKPVNVPAGFEEVMRTAGMTLMLVAQHNMQHCGQLADCRRAAGLKAFF